jgi:signal transduction histidine kinase/ActR/RegA family two-component response regulator
MFDLLTSYSTANRVLKRRVELLHLLLLGIMAAVLVLTAINLWELVTIPSTVRVFFMAVDILCLVFFAGMVYLNRTGRHRLAGYLFIVLVSLSPLMMSTEATVEQVFILNALPVMAASFILAPAYSFAAALLSASVYSAMYWYIGGRDYNYISIIVLFVLALVSWLAARGWEKSLADVERLNQDTQKQLKDLQRADAALQLNESRLEAMLWLGRMSEASARTLIHYALQEAVRLTGSEIGFVALVHPDSDEIEAYEWSDKALEQPAIADDPQRFKAAVTELGREALRQHRAIITNDYTAPTHPFKGDSQGQPLLARHIVAPIFDGARIVMVTGVGNKRTGYDTSDVQQLELLIEEAWRITQRREAELALQAERASLIQRVEEQTAELKVANAALLGTNEELARAARAKDEFLAGMSHELRTPLTAILGMSESLQEYVYGPLTERQMGSLKTIETSGRHLLELINDILDLSKIEAGKTTLDLSAVSLQQMCRDSSRFVTQTAKQKKINFILSVDESVDMLQADARRLKQIIVNLLSNAVKFTPEGGTVGLETKGYPEREAVAISVWDTGIGIAEQDLGRLFQPFVQLDSSLSRQYAGTGLGLSLVRSLTNLHGGSVTVESPSVSPPHAGGTQGGPGSRFTVLLPWKAEKMELEQRADDNARGKELSSPTIPSLSVLAVDDNPAAIAGSADLLRFRGYRVQVVSSGSEAIEYLASNKPDVILMDIQMPIMDGLVTTRRIRELGYPVPVIAVTALAMSGDRERCLAAGANEYASKPISGRELIRLIESLAAPCAEKAS